LESEGTQAAPKAPDVERQAIPAPVAPALAAPIATGAFGGNAAMASMAGGSLGAGSLSPGVVRALAPHTGNAAIARMLRGTPSVARDNGSSSSTPGGGTQAPAGAPPKLSLPGNVPVQLPAGPGEIVSKSFDKTVKAGEKTVSLRVPIPPPLAAEVGGTISGLARFAGGFAVRWDRPQSDVTDPLAVTDTVKVENARLGATGTVAGGVFGRIGVDVLLARAFATAQGTLNASGTGELNASGELTRNGVDNQWTGGIRWNLNATGTLTAAARGYFEWRVLWFKGREEIFKLESFPLGTITVKLGGELKPNGDVTCPTKDFDIQLGSPPPAKKVSSKATEPTGSAARTVARLAAGDPPPDEPPDTREGQEVPLEQQVLAGGGGESAFVPAEEEDAPEP
jgi:hypothetical protein